MCDLNQTVFMVESLSGFLANYTFGQQFQELVLEYSKGNLVYNASYVSATTSSMSELIQMLIKVISNPGNITVTGTDNLIDTSSFSSVFKRIESILQQQYTSQIVQWTTMIFGQIVPQDETTTKTFKTVNVVLEVINKQLSNIKGTITLDSLLHDEYLEKMIKSFLNVNNLGTSAIVSQEIQISKIMELVQNMTLFQHLCKVQGLADFVTAPGKNSSVAVDLERIMCFYPDAFLQALNSQEDAQYLTDQLNKIWNTSVSQAMDWGKFSGNIQNFTKLLTGLIQHQPSIAGGSWSSIFNFNMSLSAIESLFTDQDKLFSLIAAYNPLMNKDVETALYPYLSMWNQIYKHMKTLYQDLQSFGCSYTEYPNTELKPSDGSPMLITASNTETMEKCRYECERESLYSGTCVGFLYEPENGGSCVLYMNDTLPKNVVKVYSQGKHYYERNCTGRDLHGNKKNSLATIFKWLSSLETMVALTGSSSDRLMLEQTGKIPQIQTFVCTQNLLSKYMYLVDIGKISSAICGQDPKSWYDRLIDAGYYPKQITYINTGITDYMKAMDIKDPRGITWTEFISQIQDVIKMFETMDFKDLLYRFGVSLDTASTTQQTKDVIMGSLDWFKVLSDNILDNTRSSQLMLNLLTSVSSYLNRQLDRLQGAGQTVPITALLPNNTLVVNLLNEAMGQQTAAALLTAYVAPDKFLELSFSDKWTTIVCDPVEFKKTFIFPNGTLVDKIQQDLCTEAQSQKSAVEDILKRLDMTDVVKALEDVIKGGSNSPLNNTYMWKTLKQNIEQIMTNVERISGQNIDMKDIDKWLGAFESLQNPSVNSVEPICEGMVTYMRNTDVYKHTIQPLMLGIVNNLAVSKQQMKVQKAFEDIMCDLSKYNVSQIAKRLLDADLPELLKNLFHPSMNASGTFQCSTLVTEINYLSTSYTQMFTEMFNTTNNKWETCFNNLVKFPSKILNDVSQTFLIASQLLEIINDPTIKYLGQNSDLLPMMEFFVNAYLSQQDTSFKISQILTNSTSVEQYLERVLRLSPEIVNSLFKSTLNLDTIALMNNSAETVTAIFCDPQQLDDVISLPGFLNISMVSLSKTLCGPNVGSTVHVVQSVVDIGTLSLMLSKDSSNTDSGWWTLMSKHLSSVIKNFEMIGSLINFKFDFKNLDSVVPKLQRFIFDYGPEALADSINILLGDFEQLANTTESRMLIKDLQIIVNGLTSLKVVRNFVPQNGMYDTLTSLKVIRNFIPQNVVLKDVMSDPAAFRKYMIENIGLDGSVADAVLDGTIKYTYLLQYDLEDIEATFCNETRLAVFLNTNSSTVPVSNISTSLCGIGQDKVVNLTEYLLKTMNVGELVKNYVTIGIDEFMKNINITKDDAQKAIHKLSSAKADLLNAAEAFKNSTVDINLAIFNQPQALKDSLKNVVNNDSFKILEEVRQVAQSWAAGTLSLNQLLKDNRTLHDIKELLSNGLVSGMITSVIGVSGSELVNSLYSLNNIDQKQMSALANIAELVANYTKCVETNRFTGFATEHDLIQEAVKLHQKNSFLAGIVFMNMEGGSRKKRSATNGYPKHISYKIRMDIENVRHTSKLKEMMWRPDPEDNMFAMRYTRGFIQLQDLIERSIISLQTGNSSQNPSVYLQQFPTPCHRDDRYLTYLSSYLLPVMMTIAWLAAIAVATKNFVYDREIGQEEALKIMGLRTYLNWWAWFISTMIIMFIASVICLLILRFGNLFRYTDFGILLLYFMDFCFSSIMMCYMVSSFFTRTTLAMLTVLIVYLLSYLPYVVLVSMETQMTFWQKTLACLFSTTSFGFGAQYLSRYEVQGVGVHWSNIQSTPIAGDSMSFSWTCILMLIDGVIYLVIGWYVRNVKPGKYGVAQPWYFPFSPKYWGCTSNKRNKYATSRGNEVLFEPPMENWQSGISLKGLTKNYGKFKAVKNINGDFYEGQVTALLGHNGAAKTTTLYVKYDNCMTVMEHMQFYSSVKSDKSGQKMKLEIEE
ncbi:hypothetical protein KUTeg_003699 [Tegillarca granosa]|uniref:Apple domain-containing protein n=1 Tax=Tegillarca granosa TaxID=220873 RepID=A0ABQ9FMY3_TEGGR|nr:hypothetical protein KUTeg_003699 [Tegillarca granosa]